MTANVKYAQTIKSADRLNFLLHECSNDEISLIKEFFYNNCKKRTFDAAIKGVHA